MTYHLLSDENRRRITNSQMRTKQMIYHQRTDENKTNDISLLDG